MAAQPPMVNRLQAVEVSPSFRERRIEQFELISEHLACTDMTVRIGRRDAYILVEFPNRPELH